MQALVIVLLAFVALSHGYSLKANYSGADFFSHWQFFTGDDPTHGYVNYLSQSQAQSAGLIDASPGKVFIRTDSKNVASGRGRNSIRLTSNTAWNAGSLVIIDLAHMPAGCGTWPAWWMVGPNWPNNGEIDIIEGVNTQTVVATTLHTSDGCTMAQNTDKMTGHWSDGTNGQPATNCWVDAPNQASNQGCGIQGAGNSYGAPFNSAGGGVYATEWTSQYIQVFYFPRGSIPKDITADTPNPAGWGKPYAYFGLGGSCPANKFQNMNLVLDNTLCGDWAGAVFASQCPGKGACNTYVQNNPSAFAEAYWQIGYVKVFQ